MIRISLEKFKLNKHRRETIDRRSISETIELRDQGLASDRTKISSRKPESPVNANTARSKKSQILLKDALNDMLVRSSIRVDLSLITEKIKMSSHDMQSPRQTAVYKIGSGFTHSNVLMSRLSSSQQSQLKPVHKKAKSISGISAMQKKIPNIPKLQIESLQNFNDYYCIPSKKNTGNDISQKSSLISHINQLSLTDRCLDDPNQESFYLNGLHNQKAEFMSLTAREPSVQSPKSFNGGLGVKLDFKKPILTASRTMNIEHEDQNTISKKGGKNGVKPGFAEYIKRNLDIDRYFKTLERQPRPITELLLSGDKSSEPNKRDQTTKGKPSELNKQSTINKKNTSPPEKDDPQNLNANLNKSSFAFISGIQFITNGCPLGVLHQYPSVIKTPYVYDYSSNVHYNSFWLDRITELCENPRPLTELECSFYSLRNVEKCDCTGLSDDEELLMRFFERVALDIRSEHETTSKLNNSLLFKWQVA
jgi:hypothetical protein